MRTALTIIIFCLISLSASASSILKAETNKKYQVFEKCIQTLKKPDKCMSEYVEYIKSTVPLIKYGDHNATAEKNRINKTVTFLEKVANKYAEKAKDDRESLTAEKAIHIYNIIAKVKKSKGADYLQKSNELKKYTSNANYLIKLQYELNNLLTTLRNNKELSERNFEALKSLKVNSQIIPRSKYENYALELNNEINRWLLDYVDNFFSYPLKIQPSTYKARLEIYLFSANINGFENRIDQIIQKKTLELSRLLNKIGYSAELDIRKSKEYWSNLISRTNVDKIPNDIESLSRSTLNNVAISKELSRIYKAATSNWVELLSEFKYNKSLVHDQEKIAIIASKASLLNSLKRKRIIDVSIHFADLLSNDPQFNKSTQNKLNTIIENTYNSIQKGPHENLFGPLTFDIKHITEARTDSVRSIAENHAANYLKELIRKDNMTHRQIIKLVDHYYQIISCCDSQKFNSLLDPMVDKAYKFLTKKSLKKIYKKDGILELNKYIRDLPNTFQQNNSISEKMKRYAFDTFVNLDIMEINVMSEFYHNAVRPISKKDYEPYIKYYMVRLEQFKENEEYIALGLNLFGFENADTSAELLISMGGLSYKQKIESLRAKRSNLPKKDSLEIKYPKEAFIECFLDIFFASKLSLDATKNNIKGMKKYSFSILSFDSNILEKTYTNSEGVIKRYPNPLSKKELEKYNIQSFNVIKNNCFADFQLESFNSVTLN